MDREQNIFRVAAAKIQEKGDVLPDGGRQENLLALAASYKEFLAFKNLTEKMKLVVEIVEAGGEFRQELASVLQGIQRGADILERSLQNQETYKLVDKRWMRDTGSLREAFERGRLVMELDVRLDADGEFWVSHAVGARASFAPPYVHTMTTEEMKEGSKRFLVSEGLSVLREYQERGHRFILELKTLGPDEAHFRGVVERLRAMLEEKGVKESVAIASLSPGILMAVHEVMPEMPLILNGGIVPGISYSEKGENFLKSIIPRDKKWRAFGIGPVEVVVAAGETTPRRVDGEGKQTGYVLARLPNDLVDALRSQRGADGASAFAGLASLSNVSILASVLDAVGATEKAQQLRRYFSKLVDDLGVGKMATTWGQGLSAVPGLKHLAPEAQVKVFLRDFGLDVLIYTKSPEEWAHALPSDPREFIEIVGDVPKGE